MSKKVIAFHYALTDKNNQLIDSSEGHEPMYFMEGAQQIIPGLEVELVKLKLGDKAKINVKAKDAYGEKNEQMMVTVPLSKLPAKDIKVGDRFRGGSEQHAPIFTVMEVSATEAKLDGNHPLAGVDLTFDVEIMEIRQATEEELTHGHAHGPNGHHH